MTYILSSEFLMPGLIDTHVHAPQYPNAGKGLDHGLLDWLNNYTFPTEAKFQELEFAKNAYRKIVVSIWQIYLFMLYHVHYVCVFNLEPCHGYFTSSIGLNSNFR